MIKTKVMELLQSHDLAAIRPILEQYPAKDVVNALFSPICREDPLIRWPAVISMGDAVIRLAATDMEEARVVMRRFLWSLNDESGGIGWGAPECMAEIMCRHAGLAEEYIHMLISYMRQDGDEPLQDGNFLEHPILQRGLLWGIAGLSRARPELLVAKGAARDIPPYLTAPDPETRALAALAAGELRLETTRPVLHQLSSDPSPLTLYLGTDFVKTSVGAMAKAALDTLNQ
ncbi:DVU0298 family protein [Desulfobulbus alkaliphilus]|uniref:DVU0298 family protein n=1 Tax=Desulfobulbus alkaliphilus TaxID=869814 RepID=UPI0019646C8B|nr:DVU0298 family protein [Desulfobulbus alkaliphilus]MBM9537717.1 HEAT repeat domain-containing protein [Desulfobulbus alkaliphilus]